MNCLPVMQAGQALLVDGDFALDDLITLTSGARPYARPLLHQHPLWGTARRRDRGPDASPVAMPGAGLVDDLLLEPRQDARTRRAVLTSVADTDTMLMPIHFPAPTAGRIESDGTRFRYRFRQ